MFVLLIRINLVSVGFKLENVFLFYLFVLFIIHLGFIIAQIVLQPKIKK